MKKILFAFFLMCCFGSRAQQSSLIKIIAEESGENIPFAAVQWASNSGVFADTAGMAKLNLQGTHRLIVSSVGYLIDTVQLQFPLSGVFVLKMKKAIELQTVYDAVIVHSLRSNQRIEYAPIKVEVLDQEELNEESTIKPSGIGSLIGDISGIQIQQTSAVSGDANVRIQGLEGRYTQILRDGLPLYDGFSGGFGILSIPPLDLKQIELVKGSASTLYGGGAIGGLVNLISKEPKMKREAVVTLNQTTLNESNVNAYLSQRKKKAGYTLYSGFTRQQEKDVDGDGLSDVSRVRSFVFHPKIFLYPDSKTSISAGYTLTTEDRSGGDMQVLRQQQDNVHQYIEANSIIRHSAAFSVERKIKERYRFTFRSSYSNFTRGSYGSETHFYGRQQDQYHELYFAREARFKKGGSWVAGLNFTAKQFDILKESAPVLLTNTKQHTMGVFALYNYNFNERNTLEAGLRNDLHGNYGNFLLPHLAWVRALGKSFGCRLGLGASYKTPDALAPQLTTTPLEKIRPIDATVHAERAMGYNAEINYKKKWDEENDLFINQSFFLTQIEHPLVATYMTNGEIDFRNAAKPLLSKGFDTYVRLHMDELELYTGFTYTSTLRTYLNSNQFMPYTPKYRAAFTAVKEWDEKFRIGLEGSYNGFQYRENNTKTPDYFFMAAMASVALNKHFLLVLNGENLLDYRQSKVEKLYTGSITHPQFNTLWAPIDGRVINLCLKWKL